MAGRRARRNGSIILSYFPPSCKRDDALTGFPSVCNFVQTSRSMEERGEEIMFKLRSIPT
jgi:hypothetical protein